MCTSPRRPTIAFAAGTLLATFLTAAVAVFPVRAAVLVNCDSGDQGGDNVGSQGFYLPNFPGQTLDGLDLYISSDLAGTFDFSLEVREATYDGPVLGFDLATVTLTADVNDNQLTAFEFPSVGIAPGTLVTFLLRRAAGPGGTQYFSALGTPGCPFIETNGMDPPLSSFRRNGIRAVLYGQDVSPVDAVSWGRVKSAYR